MYKKTSKQATILTLGLFLFTGVAFTHAEAEMEPGYLFHDCPECPDMVVIPAGSIDMGSAVSKDEKPVHRVTISKAFAMSRTEVTQIQWRAVMQDQWRTIHGKDPSYFSSCGDNCPVEQISWNDVQIFIQKLNAITRKQYRLPSEAEWEYACRAGETHPYCGSDNVDLVAWYGASAETEGNSDQATKPVATKLANAFGLFDMSGNVWEWVEDSYHDNYKGAPTDGDAWQKDGKTRVLRGGSWFNSSPLVRATKRFKEAPTFRSKFAGFRLVRVLP
jgi:formylglycine-generating enzyme required for sulfatase activity